MIEEQTRIIAEAQAARTMQTTLSENTMVVCKAINLEIPAEIASSAKEQSSEMPKVQNDSTPHRVPKPPGQ